MFVFEKLKINEKEDRKLETSSFKSNIITYCLPKIFCLSFGKASST